MSWRGLNLVMAAITPHHTVHLQQLVQRLVWDHILLAGECRWVVKALRQRAGILMALDPRAAPIAAEIRARTQEVLRNPAGHEGARH